MRSVRVDSEFWRLLADSAGSREPGVVITVAKASGSAPGKAGAKMLVTGDAQFGTVGGGRVESAAIRHARELLARHGGPDLVKYDVVQDLGMSCGGSMTLFYEPVTPPPRLVIFGAGHIAESLCAMAALAGFEVAVLEDRKDWLTAERFPAATRLINAPLEEAVGLAEIDAATFVTSVTQGHQFDRVVVRTLLTTVGMPRYLGIIGSRRKAEVLRGEFREDGLADADIKAIRIPMGVSIGAVDPREIAVSITAELVAVLRGVDGT